MEKTTSVKKFVSAFMALLICLTSLGGLSRSVIAQAEEQEAIYSEVEVFSPYYSEQQITFPDGQQVTRSTINGPSRPLDEYQEEREASKITDEPKGTIANFPSYDWVYGCSAVSAAMIAAYYDRGSYPNLYTGPTDNGRMPLTDTSWPVWYDSNNDDYPSNPLIASRNGLDGRTTRGSIDDYWVRENHAGPDPYVTGGWAEHQWTDAVGDFMKTSQAKYNNVDGATKFTNWTTDPGPLTCEDMKYYNFSDSDGTYGRKLFYEARGYTVTDCYNQNTDNNNGGFTFAKFKSEIDAGHPVLLNLEGHSIVGYGYDGNTVYIRDTWDSNTGNVYSMPWGGSYQGMGLLSVSIVRLAPAGPGPVLPGSIYLPLIQKPAPPPPVDSNPFKNPGFEEGHAYWNEFSALGWDLIYHKNDTPVPPKSGSWLAWLGGESNEHSKLSQKITITSSSPYLHLWVWLASEDVCGYDWFDLYVDDEFVGYVPLCDEFNTNGCATLGMDLRPYVGERTVSFVVTTDNVYNSNVFIDDVKMSSQAPKSFTVPMNDKNPIILEIPTKSEFLEK